jgi:hypothetical protein
MVAPFPEGCLSRAPRPKGASRLAVAGENDRVLIATVNGRVVASSKGAAPIGWNASGTVLATYEKLLDRQGA